MVPIEVMTQDVDGIPATMPTAEVARLFEQQDFIAAPVIDEDGVVIGQITIDDVVDVCGFGTQGYGLALQRLERLLRNDST